MSIEARIIELIVLFVCFLIGKIIFPWLKAKCDYDKLQLACAYALSFVKGAEAIYGNGKGKDKLDYVTTVLSDKLNQLKIKMAPSDIRAIIEEAVMMMKSGE